MTTEEATTRLAQVNIDIADTEATVRRIRKLGLTGLSQAGTSRQFNTTANLYADLDRLYRQKQELEAIIGGYTVNTNAKPIRFRVDDEL